MNDIYDQHLEDSIYNFQKSQNIVTDIYSPGAGFFGPKTRAALKNIVNSNTPVNVSIPKEEDIFDQPVTSASSEARVKELQYVFHNLGYFQDAPDGVFDERLESAIYGFQLDSKVINSASDIGSGYYGPKTRKTLRKYHQEFQEILERISQQKTQLEEFQEKRKTHIESRNE